MYPQCAQIFIVIIIIVNVEAIAYGSVALIFKHSFCFTQDGNIAVGSLFFFPILNEIGLHLILINFVSSHVLQAMSMSVPAHSIHYTTNVGVCKQNNQTSNSINGGVIVLRQITQATSLYFTLCLPAKMFWCGPEI